MAHKELQAFRRMAGAIYKAHNLLKEIKQLRRSIKNPDEARKEIRREYAGKMKDALMMARLSMDEWLLALDNGLQS